MQVISDAPDELAQRQVRCTRSEQLSSAPRCSKCTANNHQSTLRGARISAGRSERDDVGARYCCNERLCRPTSTSESESESAFDNQPPASAAACGAAPAGRRRRLRDVVHSSASDASAALGADSAAGTNLSSRTNCSRHNFQITSLSAR